MDIAGVPGGPINSVDQVLADPQITARGLLKRMEREDGTPIDVIGFPSQFSRTPATYRIAPQTLGYDTEAVLEQLGLGTEARTRLRDTGVIQYGDAHDSRQAG